VPVRFGPGAARKRACTTGTSPAAYRCHYVLESIGLAVQLVSASQAKNLKGRPKTDLLTELLDVSAAQAVSTSRQSIVEMSARSESPGCYGRVASLIVTETGHTRLNQSPAFSSLPIFYISRSTP
jgi:hypothetical protein